jgi:hypothetical protein
LVADIEGGRKKLIAELLAKKSRPFIHTAHSFVCTMVILRTTAEPNKTIPHPSSS